MNEVQKLVRRLDARMAGRAVLLRGASDVSPDTAVTIGMATLKIVTEEHVQAIAFGSFDSAPTVITRLDPLGRDAGDLEPFAEWLVASFEEAVRDGALLRVWVPHLQTLETLDVLGHRYERNASASEVMRRMGAICRALAREHRVTGQQAIVVASSTLLEHVVTGQSPVEDGHLGAVLAWIDPPPGRNVREVAKACSIEPASGVLANYPGKQDDDLVERLRKERKQYQGRPRARNIEQRIRDVLVNAVNREWALLSEARSAFWSLPLDQADLSKCIAASSNRLMNPLGHSHHDTKYVRPRAKYMLELEDAQTNLTEARELFDGVLRAEAVQKGRAVEGVVVAVEQVRPNFKPCRITLSTDQRDLRIRTDERVRLVEASTVTGQVVSITFDESTGGSTIVIDVKDGVRAVRACLSIGRRMEWLRCLSFPVYLKNRALSTVEEPWMLSDSAVPPSKPAFRPLGGDPLTIAESYLRSAV